MNELDKYSQNGQHHIPWEGIVIHSMSQFIEGVHAINFLESIRLSAHFFVEPHGIVKPMVPVHRVAYHAGKSKWKDKVNLNSSFLGIELLIEGEHDYGSYIEAIKHPETFTDLHYRYTAILCASLIAKFDIPTENIVRHSDIAGSDVRKKSIKFDPGEGFDMSRLLESIEKQQDPNQVI
jgi:N-acetylmuramoyl-L-alanine amidase